MKDFLLIILIVFSSSLYSQISFTSTKTWSGTSVSVDGIGTCGPLPTVSFAASDFGGCTGSTYSITDVNVFIGWCKMDGTCTSPGAGNPYHSETSFCIFSPVNNENLAIPGTWFGTTNLTQRMDTWFDQAAASIPSGTPVDGTFRPNNGNLNDFNGTSPIGVWNVRAGDTGGGDPLCVNEYRIQVTSTVTPPGNPALFGANQWNVYAYNGRNRDNLAAIEYYGFYTEPLLSYDTRNRWGTSSTPALASGYLGCDPGIDNHTIVSKRLGFSCDVYQLNVTNFDDESKVLVNGTQVWFNNGCCGTATNIWTGVLDGSSTVEFVHAEGGGGSHQGLQFVDVSTVLNGGSITAPGTIVACGSLDPAPINNGASASGGSSAAVNNGSTTYQWQLNGVDIGGANGLTYDPPLLSPGTYLYTRIATDKCGFSNVSNTVTITVDAAPLAASNTTSTASICEGDLKPLIGAPLGGNWSIVSGSGSITGLTYNTGSILVDENVTIRYTISASGSCPATTSDRTFTVNANPGLANNTTSTASICESSSKALTGTPGGGTWSLVSGSGSITGSTYNPGVIAADESVTVKYTIAASGSCPATEADITFTVQNAPLAANNTTANSLICEGDTRALTGTPGGGTWNLLSGSGSIIGSTYHTGVIGADESVFISYTIAAVGVCPETNSTVVFNVQANSSAPIISPVPGSICPNTNTVLSAGGGIAGAGSNIFWYSGPGGTGTALGSGPTISVSPDLTSTYYARREGGCNTTTDASIVVNVKPYAYTPTGTTSSIGYCTDNSGWHHFYNSSDEVIFSILGDLTGAAFLPQVDIVNNGTFYNSLGTPVSCALGLAPGEASFEMQRNWNVNFTGVLNPPYKVRFYHNASEKTAIETAANNHIATYPSCAYSFKYPVPNGFYWFKNTGVSYAAPQFDAAIHLSSTTGLTANGINFAELGGISSFSGGSGGIVLSPLATLPVELLSFNAKPINNKYISLNWSTATEINNEGFDLLRSTDGENFEKIAFVEGNGNTNEKQDYVYADYDVSVGTYYYKLRQIDFDGQSEEFPVISVSLKNGFNDSEIVVSPIPSSNTINVDFNSYENTTTTISIYNFSGHKVLEIKKKIVEGNNSILIEEVSKLASGIYYLNMTLDNKIYNKKFVMAK